MFVIDCIQSRDVVNASIVPQQKVCRRRLSRPLIDDVDRRLLGLSPPRAPAMCPANFPPTTASDQQSRYDLAGTLLRRTALYTSRSYGLTAAAAAADLQETAAVVLMMQMMTKPGPDQALSRPWISDVGLSKY